MFIHDMNCSWLKHPFFRSKVRVANRQMIAKIIEHGIGEVYIDTSKGLDVQQSQFGKSIMRDIEAQLAKLKRAKADAARRDAERKRPAESRAAQGPSPASPAGAQAETPRPPTRGSALAPRLRRAPENGREAANGAGSPRAEVSVPPRAGVEEAPQEVPPQGRPAPSKRVALAEEMLSAAKIKEESARVIQGMMEEARLGRRIRMDRVYPMVAGIADSISRNRDALLTLSMVKKADDYTYMHSLSVCVLMVCFAGSLGLGREETIQAGVGALLHDAGKARLAPELLQKEGKMSPEELGRYQEHVAFGEEILSSTPDISPVALSIASQHHERYDGTGYPRGLRAEAISLHGQMAAVANMYDILTTSRWYRKGMEPTEALSRLMGWGKYRFSEEMVQKFIRCIGIYPIGTLVRLESGLLGVVVEQGSKDLLHPVVRAIYDTKREWFIKPLDMDLSQPTNNSVSDNIVCHESPDKWKISPLSYLAVRVKEKGFLSRRLHAEVS